ncbi:MAG: hypothetical protein K1Y36_24495 [Blastocatellia bacterium]|nr:hypothetical protein [Blastocatellia bacterium]
MPFLRLKNRLLDFDRVSIVWLLDFGVRIQISHKQYFDICRIEDCDAVWNFFQKDSSFVQVRHDALVNFNNVVEVFSLNDVDIRLVLRNEDSIDCCAEFRNKIRTFLENLEAIPMMATDQKLVSLSLSDQERHRGSRKTRI